MTLYLKFGVYLLRMPKVYFFVIFFFISLNSFAGLRRDTFNNAPQSPLKTMSYAQYKGYTEGVDSTGMANVAELNHFPSPEKVIALKKELSLTTDQVIKIRTINSDFKRKMKEMGGFIIKNEKVLDSLFRTKTINDGSLIFYTNRFGLYQGEMRNAVLQAYYKAFSILNPTQIEKYQNCRNLNAE